jgi:hypothetical protein
MRARSPAVDTDQFDPVARVHDESMLAPSGMVLTSGVRRSEQSRQGQRPGGKMKMKKSVVQHCGVRAILACMLGAVCTSASAVSTSVDYTDTWWNPAEGGWGLQFVQQVDFMFATIYIQDAQTNPVWFTALLRPGSDGVWQGDLYETHGPWFGGPFNAAPVANRRVGDFNATFASSEHASIAYSVDGVPVAKSIERYTMATESLTGQYGLWLHAQTVNCSGSPPGAISAPATGTIVHSGNSLHMTMTITVAGTPLACSYDGNYAQSGRYGNSDGTYNCAGGDTGAYQLRDVQVTPDVFTGRLMMHGSDGCTSSGAMGGYRE